MGHHRRTRIQGWKTDGQRDDYTKLFLIPMNPHERKMQRTILTEGGRGHFLTFLAGQTPLFLPHYMSEDLSGWGSAPFLPRLVILALIQESLKAQ